MNKSKLIASWLLALALLGVIALLQCVFIVDEREQVVVTRLSKPIRVIIGSSSPEEYQRLQQEILGADYRSAAEGETIAPASFKLDQGAGLYFRMPFVDTVERFPDVLMAYDAEPEDVVTADKKKLIVDNFARWRVENPLLYRIRVRTASAANGVLDDIIYSVVREELGKNNLIEVIRTSNTYLDHTPSEAEDATPEAKLTVPMRDRITSGREAIMKSVSARADEVARRQYGIRVIDVRIKRAELLPENLQGVFGRMQAERLAISKAYRSEGRKQADIIEGNTNRQMQVITANAERDAMILKGDGDAEAVHIYAEAFSSNPQLYEFMRSLEVMSQDTPAGSELVLGLDSGIYSLLKNK